MGLEPTNLLTARPTGRLFARWRLVPFVLISCADANPGFAWVPAGFGMFWRVGLTGALTSEPGAADPGGEQWNLGVSDSAGMGNAACRHRSLRESDRVFRSPSDAQAPADAGRCCATTTCRHALLRDARVWACPDHLDGLTGLREFGRRR
jgi:hypothetical protein